MTLETQILKDLEVGPSTAHSIAGRMGKHTEGVLSQLSRLEKEGRVVKKTICDGSLLVWYRIKEVAV